VTSRSMVVSANPKPTPPSAAPPVAQKRKLPPKPDLGPRPVEQPHRIRRSGCSDFDGFRCSPRPRRRPRARESAQTRQRRRAPPSSVRVRVKERQASGRVRARSWRSTASRSSSWRSQSVQEGEQPVVGAKASRARRRRREFVQGPLLHRQIGFHVGVCRVRVDVPQQLPVEKQLSHPLGVAQR
jgi:hypothetical protein